ncbi:MAG TPA: polysaccharide deacetylase family protein [Xanthobacteraceae bacterium]|nr:polysaccharide deacetylase family protein [Xanthobacteraceae bacterium]
MRVVIACVIVVLSVLAALAVAQTQNVFSSFTGRSEAPAAKAPTQSPAPTRVAAAPSSPVQTVAPSPVTPVATPAPVAAAPQPAPAPAVHAAPAASAGSTQHTAPAPAAAPPATQQIAQAAAPPPPAPAPVNCPGNPNALGIARTVEIDTTGGPGFGFEHFKQHDFLRPGEVVLTFDDGPWLTNTPMVLTALAHHCVRAIFFPIGKHATYYPDILKQVAAAGHAVGSHTWSHQNLNKKGMTIEDAKTEIEMGISAVRLAVGGATAPFFRFPALQHPPELVTYLGERNIAIFSTDMDSFDFKMRKSDQVIKSVMEKLKKHNKGMVLMHDFQHATAEGIGTLLDQLKLNGYKVVHMRPKAPLQSLPKYDEMVIKEQKLPTVSGRPTAEVVKTVE